jgi:hypothetical protein
MGMSKNIARQIALVALSGVIFLLAFLLFNYVLSEVAVYHEMATTGAKARAELGDDFGLGILLLFVVMPVSFVAAFFVGLGCWVVGWRRLRRK